MALTGEKHKQQANQHRNEANEPKLTVIQLNHALESLSPGFRRYQWQYALQHQH
jgi:hypothetical protein